MFMWLLLLIRMGLLLFIMMGWCFVIKGLWSCTCARQASAIERVEQLQAARQAEDDMSATMHAQLIKAGSANGGDIEQSQGAVNIEKIRAVALCDKKEEKRMERIQELENSLNSALLKAEHIQRAKAPEEGAEDGDAVITDLNKKHSKAKDYLSHEFKAKLDSLREQIKEQLTVQGLKLKAVEVNDTWKLLSKAAVEDYITYVKRFNQASSAMGRGPKAKRGDTDRQRADAPKHPLFVSLMKTLTTEVTINVSASVFEAKGGLRPALVDVTSEPNYDKIMKSPVVKKTLAVIAKSLKGGTTACVQPIEAAKAVQKKLDETIMVTVTPELMTKCPLPKGPWALGVFRLEIVGSGMPNANVMWGSLGMMSVNLVRSGDCAFMGIPQRQGARQQLQIQEVLLVEGNCRPVAGTHGGGQRRLVLQIPECPRPQRRIHHRHPHRFRHLVRWQGRQGLALASLLLMPLTTRE